MGIKIHTERLLSLSIAGFARALRPFHESPIDVNLLPENVGSIHSFLGSEGLLVRLVLDQSVSLQESGAAVEIHVDVFDVAELAELLLDVIFMGFLVDGGDEQDPSFNS